MAVPAGHNADMRTLVVAYPVAYPLSVCHLESMSERAVSVDVGEWTRPTVRSRANRSTCDRRAGEPAVSAREMAFVPVAHRQDKGASVLAAQRVAQFMDRTDCFHGLPKTWTCRGETTFALSIGASVPVVEGPVLVHPVILTTGCPRPPRPIEKRLAFFARCAARCAARRGAFGKRAQDDVPRGVIAF